jgi:hypothetical protein
MSTVALPAEVAAAAYSAAENLESSRKTEWNIGDFIVDRIESTSQQPSSSSARPQSNLLSPPFLTDEQKYLTLSQNK